jgi:hypothetical protein
VGVMGQSNADQCQGEGVASHLLRHPQPRACEVADCVITYLIVRLAQKV